MPLRVWPARAAGSLGAAAALGGAAPLPGQPAGSPRIDAEVGAAVVRQPGVPSFAAPTLGGAWAWDGARTAVRADAVVAAGANAWSGQLAASAAHFRGDPDAPFELGGGARIARAPAARATAQLTGDARRHLTFGGALRPAGGVWVGAVGGLTTGVGGAAPFVGVDAGAWRAVAATRLVATATWTATRADSAALAAALASPNGAALAPGSLAPGTSRVHTLDVAAAVERIGPAIELAGSMGARHTALAASPDGSAGRGWGALALGAVTWWARPGVGLVAGAGTQPAEPARGLPPVRHVALTLRLRPRAWGGARGAAAIDVARPTGAVPRAADVAVPAVAAADGSHVLRVSAPGAVRVELRAAATGWRPVDLARGAGGEWAITLAWPAGAHRVALRVDGGAWRAPANVPTVDDEFGGQVGLLVVP